MNISVVGGGAFGTALANALKKENQITIYARNNAVISEINDTRKNQTYFPHKILSKQIKASSDIETVNAADVLFLCIPSYTIVDFIKKLNLKKDALIVNGAKGFGSGKKLIPDAVNEVVPNRVCALKGPSFANELIFEVPTAFTLAGSRHDDFVKVKNIFREDVVVFDYTNDVTGVENLSIMKNIYAIIVGIVDAYYNSSNVRFLIFTKAINEIKKLLTLLNVPPETMFCYAGIGDFGLTALNDLSRNRTLGLLIGKGFFGKDASNMVVLEGVRAIDNVINTIADHHLAQLPLLSNLDNLLKGKIDVRQFINHVIYS